MTRPHPVFRFFQLQVFEVRQAIVYSFFAQTQKRNIRKIQGG